jgi:hypothetical protein
MKKYIAMMAIVATAGLLAACQPGKPIQATAYQGHMSSAQNTNTSSAPVYAGKSGRTFESQ